MRTAAAFLAALALACAKPRDAVEEGATVGAGVCFSWNWSEDGLEWEGVTLTAGPEAASRCGGDDEGADE